MVRDKGGSEGGDPLPPPHCLKREAPAGTTGAPKVHLKYTLNISTVRECGLIASTGCAPLQCRSPGRVVRRTCSRTVPQLTPRRGAQRQRLQAPWLSRFLAIFGRPHPALQQGQSAAGRALIRRG